MNSRRRISDLLRLDRDSLSRLGLYVWPLTQSFLPWETWFAVMPAFLSLGFMIFGVVGGTAFGMFNVVTGLALLATSIVAGALWDAGFDAGERT
jgi:hypothetical protein